MTVPLKLGVCLPQSTTYDLATDIVEAARAVERMGFDSVWAFERVLSPCDQSGAHGLYGVPDLPWPDLYGIIADPLITLAMAAAVTDRIQLGTGALVPPLHIPLKLAKTLASLDVTSGGRLIAGLGCGWSIDEFLAAAPRPFAERGAALDEFLDVAEAAWGPDPVVLGTGHYQIGPAAVNPKPAHRIPVYLAGSNRTAFTRIARRADGWLATMVSPMQAAAALAQIREMAAAAGRDPADIGCIFRVGLPVDFTEVPTADRAPYTGSIAQIVEDIAALSAGGVHHAYLTVPDTTGDIKEFIDTSARLYDAVRDAGLFGKPVDRRQTAALHPIG